MTGDERKGESNPLCGLYGGSRKRVNIGQNCHELRKLMDDRNLQRRGLNHAEFCGVNGLYSVDCLLSGRCLSLGGEQSIPQNRPATQSP